MNRIKKEENANNEMCCYDKTKKNENETTSSHKTLAFVWNPYRIAFLFDDVVFQLPMPLI